MQVHLSHPRLDWDASKGAALDESIEITISYVEIKPGQVLPKHYHPGEEYIYVLEGGGEITIDGRAFPLSPGSGVFMPANAEVSFKATQDGRTRVLQVFAPRGPESKYDAWAPAPEL